VKNTSATSASRPVTAHTTRLHSATSPAKKASTSNSSVNRKNTHPNRHMYQYV
jgi:hypothetical protein